MRARLPVPDPHKGEAGGGKVPVVSVLMPTFKQVNFIRRAIDSLVACLQSSPGSVLAYSGVKHHYNRSAEGQIPGYSLQLVQVVHCNVALHWLDRSELVTDDLERMGWNQLRRRYLWRDGVPVF